MTDLAPKDKLKRLTTEQIQSIYRSGEITVGDRNKLLRAKARNTLDGILDEEGPLMAVWKQSVKHFQEGWDDFKDAATRADTGFEDENLVANLKATALAVWGQAQMLLAVPTAIGEVTGQEVERMALRAGASPGVARVLNVAANIGTGFFPVGRAVRSGVKGTQALLRGAKAIKKGEEAARAAKGSVTAAQAGKEQAALKAMTDGLELEGVSNAKKVMGAATQVWSLPNSKAEYIQHFTGQGWTEAQAEKFVAKMENTTWYHGSNIKGAKAIEEAGSLGAYKGRIWLTPDKEQAVEYARQKGGKVFSVKRKDIPQEILESQNIELTTGGPAVSLPGTDWPGFAKTVIPIITPKEQFLADWTKFADEMKGVTATQTHEQTAKLAEKLNLSLDDLKAMPMFKAMNEAEMYGYLKALDPQIAQWQALAKQAVDTGTEQAANAFAEFTSTIFSPLLKFRSSEVTAGRSVEILKETPPAKSITNMLMEWDPEAIAKGDFIGAMQSLAEDVLAAADQPEALKQLAVAGQSGLWPMARELYLNMLLPFSMVPSFVGNTIAVGQHMAERFTGAAFSAEKGAGLVGSGIPSFSKGLMLAMGDGIKAFGRAFKRLTPEEMGRLDYQPGAIPGVVGHIIRTPTHGTVGMDNFFKTLLRRATYYDDAMQDAERLGLSGAELGKFVQRRLTWPTQAMKTNAEEVSTTLTFQSELGDIGKKLRGVFQYGPGVLYFPFMKTGIDLIKYGWNRTPGLQLLPRSLYDDIAAGGVKADEAIGRLTMSNLQAMFVYELAKEGFITGGGPVDPVLRKAWLATHEPYSAKTKNGWVPYTNEDPMTQPVSIIADFTQIMDQLDEPSAKQAGLAMAYVVMRDSVNKSWWPAANQLLDIMQGVTRGQPVTEQGQKVLQGPLVTVATGGAIGGRIERVIDPVNRDARGLYESIAAKLPGYSHTQPPLTDDYGDILIPAQPVGNSWFGLLSPLWPKYKPKTTDRVKLEGDKLQVRVPDFPNVIGGTARDEFDLRAPLPEDRLGTELTTQQKARWKELYRLRLRDPGQGIESTLLDNPDYQEQPRAMKREMFTDFLASTRVIARETLKVEDTELGKKILNSEASRILPMLQQQDRAEAERQIQESLGLFDEMAPEALDNLMRFGDFEPEKEVEE